MPYGCILTETRHRRQQRPTATAQPVFAPGVAHPEKGAYTLNNVYMHMNPVAQPALTPACACGRLRRATRALTQLYDDVMAPSGLRVTQFSLLRTLAREGTSRMSALAESLLLDRTALSLRLRRLVGSPG